MRVSCQIFKSNVSSESSKPVWVGAPGEDPLKTANEIAVVWEADIFLNHFLYHPTFDARVSCVSCFLLFRFFHVYRRSFEEFVVEETIMVDSMHGPPRCIFSFLAFARFKVFTCSSWKRRNHGISENPNDVGHTEGLLMEEIRPTSPGMYTVIPVESIMAINYFAG